MIDVWKSIYCGTPPWRFVESNAIGGKKSREIASLNAAKVLCAEMASLCFGEKCDIRISDSGLDDFVKEVLADNGFVFNFTHLLEEMFALGGAVIKPRIEGKKIRLDYVSADCFFPISWDNEKITNAAFVNTFVRDCECYSLIEKHLQDGKNYIVSNKVFEGRITFDYNGEVIGGGEVPLREFFPELASEVKIKGLKKPLFAYFRPNAANNKNDSPCGISIFANAVPTIKALDICFDSFVREFVLGKRRIIVPAAAVRTVTDINGITERYFDANDEVFQAFAFDDAKEMKIFDNSVELRVDEHVQALNALLSLLALQVGVSNGAFSFNVTQGMMFGARGAKTATEVISDNAKTFRTVKTHQNALVESLKSLVCTIVDFGRLYGLVSGGEFDVFVRFDDGIVEDKQTNIENMLKLSQSGLLSKYSALIKFLDYSPEEALSELEKINQEIKRGEVNGR
ncbi:MAG: phage portal protein [Clostridiales bacterium]|jgi:A118 family predicted phage portal protein|nr:phage portal protein [Clostridiales bacterium]